MKSKIRLVDKIYKKSRKYEEMKNQISSSEKNFGCQKLFLSEFRIQIFVFQEIKWPFNIMSIQVIDLFLIKLWPGFFCQLCHISVLRASVIRITAENFPVNQRVILGNVIQFAPI